MRKFNPEMMYEIIKENGRALMPLSIRKSDILRLKKVVSEKEYKALGNNIIEIMYGSAVTVEGYNGELYFKDNYKDDIHEVMKDMLIGLCWEIQAEFETYINGRLTGIMKKVYAEENVDRAKEVKKSEDEIWKMAMAKIIKFDDTRGDTSKKFNVLRERIEKQLGIQVKQCNMSKRNYIEEVRKYHRQVEYRDTVSLERSNGICTIKYFKTKREEQRLVNLVALVVDVLLGYDNMDKNKEIAEVLCYQVGLLEYHPDIWGEYTRNIKVLEHLAVVLQLK